MQIIEVTELAGVRSAVMTFRHPAARLRFVLYPMIHVGEPEFYAQVQEELRGCDIVLAEGVNGLSLSMRARIASYRLVTKNDRFALVPQHIDYAGLDAAVIRADMTGREFTALWRKIPLVSRILLSSCSCSTRRECGCSAAGASSHVL
ncbi:hypothetical protein [Thermocatellispora tengchongensis]|uniref:hypothetical protein n=1 Tax=Thermocatellispora tengchongensis TaxID=1073253 RepID=UPI00362543C7